MKILVLTLLLFGHLSLASSVRSQFFVSALNTEFALRNNTALFFGFEIFSIGGFFQYEAPFSYVKEESFGVSIRSGKDLVFELGGGSYKRKFEEVSGTGLMGYVSLGKRIASQWVITFTLSYKDLSKGDLEKRTVVDAFPTLGFDWDF